MVGIDSMATSTTTAFPLAHAEPVTASAPFSLKRRRLISPEAGHALEILGHAIEYLTDEYVHDGGTFSAHDARIEAVQMLMSINRLIYLACPERPALHARCRAWLGMRAR